MDGYDPFAVRLDDLDFLESDGRGVLNRLVAGDDPALLVDQDGAAQPVLAQGALNEGVPAFGAQICVLVIGYEL